MPVLLISLFDPVLYFIGETFGISHTSASESGVFLACIPVAALIASTVMLHKRPSRQQVIGILITLIGVLITVLASNATTSLSIIGYLFLLLAVCSYALYTVFVEKAVDFTGIEATYMMLIAGALVFVTLALTEAKLNHSLTSLITLPMTDTAFLTAVLYQAIGSSVLALFLSNYAIAKVGVNRAASFIGISTVVSIIAGVLFLGEHFGGYQIIGAVIIITGVYLANMIIKI